jgi:DNA-binding transcriptional LysR family regulator
VVPDLDLSHINTNLLVALDALLTEVSVSRAAERHRVTASAMSHSLRQLRELFGDQLLIRSRHGMRLSPLAAALANPLHKALRELALTVKLGPGFEAATSERSFVIAAPDFLSTLVLGPLMEIIEQEAPGIDVEVRPLPRRGAALALANPWNLEEGTLDLVLGAVVPDAPGILREHLYDEHFVCLVRQGHPALRRKRFDVDAYCKYPHLLVTITDERSSTWIDEALAARDKTRTIRARTRYFMAAPILVSTTDLMLTCPYQLARHFTPHYPLRVLEPPLELPHYAEYQAWHERFDADPGHRWLREAIGRAARLAVAEES